MYLFTIYEYNTSIAVNIYFVAHMSTNQANLNFESGKSYASTLWSTIRTLKVFNMSVMCNVLYEQYAYLSQIPPQLPPYYFGI